MNKLNAIIIEDEVPAARLLHSMITRLRPQWTLTIIPGSVDEAVAWFKDNPQPDLIFLDIQLADGNAFDFLSAVHPSSIIIFTTAYDQYAIRAFTVNSIDYILKPHRRNTSARCHHQIRNFTKQRNLPPPRISGYIAGYPAT